MDLYKTISILVFQKYSVITSLAIHTIFLILIILSITYKPNLPLINNQIIEVQLFSQSKNKKKNISQKENTLIKKKIDEPIFFSNDLDSVKEIKKKNTEKKTNNLVKNQNKLEKKDKFLEEEEQNKKIKTNKSKNVENFKENFSEESQSKLKPTEEEKNYLKSLENYKVYLKNKIQKEASIYYPRVSMRKREEGNVEIVFSLDQEGVIKKVTIGNKTTASIRIIESLTKVLKNKIVKFEKNKILKKTNTFSINIVYKLR